MGLPKAAVAAKMAVEGAESSVLDLDPNQPTVSLGLDVTVGAPVQTAAGSKGASVYKCSAGHPLTVAGPGKCCSRGSSAKFHTSCSGTREDTAPPQWFEQTHFFNGSKRCAEGCNYSLCWQCAAAPECACGSGTTLKEAKSGFHKVVPSCQRCGNDVRLVMDIAVYKCNGFHPHWSCVSPSCSSPPGLICFKCAPTVPGPTKDEIAQWPEYHKKLENDAKKAEEMKKHCAAEPKSYKFIGSTKVCKTCDHEFCGAFAFGSYGMCDAGFACCKCR
jgi:hypothetical protein